jgi:hypothetical protein
VALVLAASMLVALQPDPVAAADEDAAGGDVQELAKKSQNPVASLVSLPFENKILPR